jgi:hypothetical protein
VENRGHERNIDLVDHEKEILKVDASKKASNINNGKSKFNFFGHTNLTKKIHF